MQTYVLMGQGNFLRFCCPPACSNSFLCETNGLTEILFHVEPPYIRGTRDDSSDGLGHITKKAASHICDKKTGKESSAPKSKGH